MKNTYVVKREPGTKCSWYLVRVKVTGGGRRMEKRVQAAGIVDEPTEGDAKRHLLDRLAVRGLLP